MSKPIELQLEDILNEYLQEAGDNANKAFKDVGKDTSADLKATSPRGFHTEHYADGWAYRVSGKGLATKVVIYNKTKPSLTHLLENGHEVYPRGRAKPIPHIEPAQKKATEELLQKLRSEL